MTMTQNAIVRLTAALAAAGLTATLFVTMVSFAEPQRSVLMARHAAPLASTHGAATVRVAAAR